MLYFFFSYRMYVKFDMYPSIFKIKMKLTVLYSESN